MMNKTNAIKSLISLILWTSSSLVSADTHKYIQAATGGGVIILNQKNGVITYCETTYSSQSEKYTPNCATIGTISPHSLVGNASILLPTASNVAVITNQTTGVVAQCTLLPGATGSCTSFQAD
ncbi:hypothetical protein KEF85_05720 [Methylomonas paludis]|uniref:Uncharacterized protein n=1 Tax=Methylomonas paludis TaxID=1173101 RepID=A0A975MQ49_9GAMM|nr:hypothetical protein [Methylomonas paludis]QWF71956.1 hypothetical protein KEF85_05720 [Methylomonas paludis]